MPAHLRSAIVAVVLLLLIPTLVLSKTEGTRSWVPTQNIDAPYYPTIVDSVVNNAFDDFLTTYGSDWQALFSDRSGVPRRLYGSTTNVQSGAPITAADGFVDAQRALFGLSDLDNDFTLGDEEILPEGPVVTLLQTYAGLPVADGSISVYFNVSNEIYHVVNSTWPVSGLSITPGISAGAAETAARGAFGGFDGTLLGGPTLSVYKTGDGLLCYDMEIEDTENLEPWRVIVDAITGDVLDMILLVAPLKERGGTVSAPIPEGCDRMWVEEDPHGEASVTVLDPGSPYKVGIHLGPPGADVTDPQPPGIRAAGIKLLPSVRYFIHIFWDAITWDSYNDASGKYDVFFATVNSDSFYWDLGTRPSTSLFCGSAEDSAAALPGSYWLFGGTSWVDSMLCDGTGSVTLSYYEPDTSKTVYFSIGLDCSDGAGPHGFASWGDFVVDIDAFTPIFNPNPVTTLNTMVADNTDQAVVSGAYTHTVLGGLTDPGAGKWKLEGPWVKITDKHSPSPPEAESHREESWPYTRTCKQFEGVMCYEHINRNQVYIQSLGIGDINKRQIEVDPHGLDNQDQSYYWRAGAAAATGTGYLRFGDGGVDDAEDADVVVHEYAHAIQDNQRPGVYYTNGTRGFGDETAAMREGFGDYWACSAFNAENMASGFDPTVFAEFDAQSLTGLRKLDNTKKYPDDHTGSLHKNGEIWSGLLWDIFELRGKAFTDKLVLAHHRYIGNQPLMTDAANALFVADILQNSGDNRDFLIDRFYARGLIRKLLVSSTPEGVYVSSNRFDEKNRGGGTTNFERLFMYGEEVKLTAQANHPESGQRFVRWIVNGTNQTDSVRTVTVKIDSSATDHTAIAFYETPVAVLITRFGAENSADGVALRWQIQADEGVAGFDVYRATGLSGGDDELRLVTSSPLRPDAREFVDASVEFGEAYRYVLVAVHADGGESRSAAVGVQTHPVELALYQNHPNPFNPSTTIAFSLPEATPIRLAVYSPSGRLVRTLASEFMTGGLKRVEWDGRNDSGERVSSGVYFYRLSTGREVLTRKMVLIK